jgi:shikimate kinase
VAGGDDRPLLGEDRAAGLQRLRRERETWYRETSRVRVNAAGTLEEVLERVVVAAKEFAP